jgi:hypothetical protein
MDNEFKATKYSPTIKLDLILHLDENMLLQLADVCQADFMLAEIQITLLSYLI